jgi:hypothetical protein
MEINTTLQQEFDNLLEKAESSRPIDFQIGAKYSWRDLERLTPEQYQELHPNVLAFENIKPKQRAKSVKWIDPVYYAIFSKATHMYILLMHNQRLLKAELERMINNDSSKPADTWQMNLVKLKEYLHSGCIFAKDGRYAKYEKVEHSFTVDGKRVNMNEFTRKKLIEMLEEYDFLKKHHGFEF